MERIIFHIDVNNAYLSWEALYRIQELGESLDLPPSAETERAVTGSYLPSPCRHAPTAFRQPKPSERR